MVEQIIVSQGTEVNKNSTSYTSAVSPQKKKKKKEKKNKERVWGQTTSLVCVSNNFEQTPFWSIFLSF